MREPEEILKEMESLDREVSILCKSISEEITKCLQSTEGNKPKQMELF